MFGFGVAAMIAGRMMEKRNKIGKVVYVAGAVLSVVSVLIPVGIGIAIGVLRALR
jgi:hypothetical protein